MEKNTLAYWSHRFQTDWELKSGRDQSRFFAKLAIREAPRWLTEAIRRQGLSVCDYGCALGDGTDLLSNAWGSAVTGVDFSDVAIEEAKKKYRRPSFLAADFTAPTKDALRFDVMFSSNTLEHFADPWHVAHQISKFADTALVFMVPYEEFDRHEEHESIFLAANIPTTIGEFILSHAKVIDCDREPECHWRGSQILLSYITQSFAKQLSLTLADLQTDVSVQVRQLRSELLADRLSYEEERTARDRERESLANDLNRMERAKLEITALLESERSKLSSLESILQEEKKQLSAELDRLRLEAAKRNYWEYRARALERSTSWRVTSVGRAVKTSTLFALQAGRIKKRVSFVGELARTRGLPFAGAWLWQRLSEGHEHTDQSAIALSRAAANASAIRYDLDKDGHASELKSFLRERSYAGVFVMGSRHMGWHEVFKQRHHHIADYLISKGYLILCAMNPDYASDYTKTIKHDADRLFLVNFDDSDIKRQLIELLALESRAPLYYHLVGTEPGTTFEDIAILKRLGYTIIYDYFDEVSKEIYPALSDYCIDRHEALLKDGDVLVVASSDNLLRKASRYRTKNVICAVNGVRIEDWTIEGNAAVPVEMAGILAEGKPIVGYYGSFASWMNYDFLATLARQRPDLNIVMIGYDYEWGRGAFANSRIAELPNVHVLPPQKYQMLKYFSRFFDVGVIPFRDYELTKSVSPVKMFEYMAQGIPIVASGLEECRKYVSCLNAATADDFLAAVGRALNLKADQGYIDTLRREAEENTWAARGELVETAMVSRTQTERGKLLTIVVPTYNMEVFLERCLDSILPQSQLGRLEVLVVNDGSKDRSLEIARQYEARLPEVVRVIDKENGGHGSALNVGIRLARGKYFKVVDADDWLGPTELVSHLVFLAQNDVDMIVTNYLRTYDDRGEEAVSYSDRLQEKEYGVNDFYRAINRDSSHLSYVHMHATTYRTKVLRDNGICITEKSFYVDQEYIAFPQKHLTSVRYQNIFLYRYYNGRSGQSVAPDVARKRAPENLRILHNILATCDALPAGASVREYLLNIAYHQSWFYLTYSGDLAAKRELMRWWRANNHHFCSLLNERFQVLSVERNQ